MISSVILGSSVVDFVSPITIFSLSFRSFLSVKVIIITMIVFGKSFSHFLLGSQIYIYILIIMSVYHNLSETALLAASIFLANQA